MESRVMNERRRTNRLHSWGGRALCRVGRAVERYDVADLSDGGARLVGGPPLPVDKRLDVDLFWTGLGAGSARAHVVRTSRSGDQGIAFDDVSDRARFLVGQLSRVERERQMHPVVLIVTPREELGRDIVARLRSYGRRALAVQTALDAIVHLQDVRLPIAEAWVDPELDAGGFRRFLNAEFPYVEAMHPQLATQRASSSR